MKSIQIPRLQPTVVSSEPHPPTMVIPVANEEMANPTFFEGGF